MFSHVLAARLFSHAHPKQEPKFHRDCGKRCKRRVAEVFKPAFKAFKDYGGNNAEIATAAHLYSSMCVPLLDAILDSCGQRNGTLATHVTYAYSLGGDIDSILKMQERGYTIIDREMHLKYETMNPPLPLLLTRYGRIDAAKTLIAAAPGSGALVDHYGVSAHDAIAAIEAGHIIPKDFVAPKSKAEYGYSNGNGGWPTDKIKFPDVAGWDGKCEIAELSGADVYANSGRFIRDFLLKHRPVIVRDFIRHDPVSVSS